MIILKPKKQIIHSIAPQHVPIGVQQTWYNSNVGANVIFLPQPTIVPSNNGFIPTDSRYTQQL